MSRRDNRVVRMFTQGRLTQVAIAEKLGMCRKTVRRILRKREIPTGLNRAVNVKKGPDNPAWKGEEAGMTAKHARVYRKYGAPEKCEHCGTEKPGLRYEWANVSGDYNDPDDFVRLCRPCHVEFDDINAKISEAKRGEGHHLALVTAEEVLEIRARYKRGGLRYKDLAKDYPISWQAVGCIVRGETWPHLPV